MNTQILQAHDIDRAVEYLQQGHLVALPTETVYGLAADALSEGAIQKVFEAKQRPSDHPLIVHLHSIDDLDQWVTSVSAQAQTLAQHFWPGPLTMIFKKKAAVSDVITGGLDTVAVRVPRHPSTLEVLRKLGRAVVAPSANAYQKTSPTQAAHVLKTLGGKIAAVLDGGMASVGIESTIVDMTRSTPTILRYGAITQSMIEAVLGLEIACPLFHNEKVSGNMKYHYQPDKPVYLLSMDEISRYSCAGSQAAVMHYSPLFECAAFESYKMPESRDEYAQRLYSMLYEIDETSVDRILVEMPPSSSEWADIRDRLLKASQKPSVQD